MHRAIFACLAVFSSVSSLTIVVDLDVPFSSEAYVNVLYWRPTHDGAAYAIVQVPDVADTAASVTPSSHVGYEVGGSMQLFHPCLFIGGRYLAFDTSPACSRVVAAPDELLLPLFAGSNIFGSVSSGSAAITSGYRTADLQVGCSVVCQNWSAPFVVAGVRYFNLSEVERYSYVTVATGSVVPAAQLYSWRGWGPRIGLEYMFSPFMAADQPWGMLLCTQVGFLAAIANNRLEIFSQIVSGAFGQTDIIYPSRRAINMAFDLKLEVQGWVCIGTIYTSVRLGYELDTYLNARTRVDTTNVFIVADRNISAMGYGGPYLGLSIGF